jgi:hypothetical protein
MAPRLIPSPDRCFGPDRPVREGDEWDEIEYAKWVIDNESPDYAG